MVFDRYVIGLWYGARLILRGIDILLVCCMTALCVRTISPLTWAFGSLNWCKQEILYCVVKKGLAQTYL